MEYTVQQLGRLAGVSARTLRYYDEIGLLKPARTNSSGYRIYGPAEVNSLQQIMFYKELGFDLERIREIMAAPSFDVVEALKEHHAQLLERREQLDQLIANVEKTMAFTEGRITMTDQEKFEGFKKRLVDENEKRYGKETREKYGDDKVNRSNERVLDMTQAQYAEATRLEKEIKETLAQAFETGDPAGALAQKAADLHRQWLTMFWSEYSKEAHAGVAQMYVDDERFTAYYDEQQPGTAAFLRDAIHIYTGFKK